MLRSINRSPCPKKLADNHDSWLTAHLNDKKNKTKKYRYRHKDIKTTIRSDTGNKCVYCESKIGDTTPGDIEHYVPISVDNSKIFEWENLLLACTECNRRKGTYFDPNIMFLNPYVDDVENMVIHAGPILVWHPGDDRAEATVRVLELNDTTRDVLITQKTQKILDITNLLTRIRNTKSNTMRALLLRELNSYKESDSEYSGLVLTICRMAGF